jgi:hypothetical protein
MAIRYFAKLTSQPAAYEIEAGEDDDGGAIGPLNRSCLVNIDAGLRSMPHSLKAVDPEDAEARYYEAIRAAEAIKRGGIDRVVKALEDLTAHAELAGMILRGEDLREGDPGDPLVLSATIIMENLKRVTNDDSPERKELESKIAARASELSAVSLTAISIVERHESKIGPLLKNIDHLVDALALLAGHAGSWDDLFPTKTAAKKFVGLLKTKATKNRTRKEAA